MINTILHEILENFPLVLFEQILTCQGTVESDKKTPVVTENKSRNKNIFSNSKNKSRNEDLILFKGLVQKLKYLVVSQ